MTDQHPLGSCRPVLRWAGSKLKLIPQLEAYWHPHHTRYVEPFAGSACLFFHLSPTKAVLGDNNSELIELYSVLQTDADRIVRRLAHIPHDADTYYRWRSVRPSELDRETRALRFLYLNRHCFNGIFRTNDKGDFNVPFGTKLGRPLTPAAIKSCAERLAHAQLVCGDFEEVTQLARTGDLVYLDPPFAMATKRNRRQYGHQAFSGGDIERLKQALRELDRNGAHFLLSYGDSTEARRLADSWFCNRVQVRRHVAGFSKSRRNSYELMISNFIPRPNKAG